MMQRLGTAWTGVAWSGLARRDRVFYSLVVPRWDERDGSNVTMMEESYYAIMVDRSNKGLREPSDSRLARTIRPPL
jgi:hypothetical protein